MLLKLVKYEADCWLPDTDEKSSLPPSLPPSLPHTCIANAERDIGAGSPSARMTCEAVLLKLVKYEADCWLPDTDKEGGGGKKEALDA